MAYSFPLASVKKPHYFYSKNLRELLRLLSALEKKKPEA
jgi:UDP-glucose 4-epimerase